MNVKTLMHGKKIYYPNHDKVLCAEQIQCLDVVFELNQTRPSEQQKRQALIKKLFAEVGENCQIESPVHAAWGIYTSIGKNFYANFNLTLIDDTYIVIGDDVMVGPNVTIATAGHPVEPERRKNKAQFNVPVTIGNNVWLGAGTVILPGVNIGENTVIGAGSIVTKPIPPNVVAVGNPCKVLREISGHDKEFYFQDLCFSQGE